MIDRKARNQLIEAIEWFMDEKTTSWAFDDLIMEIAADSEDKTIDMVAMDLWFLYDDCKNHTIVATKAVWDYLQRVIVLLRSDAEVSVERGHVWHWQQSVAAAALVAFVAIALPLGWGSHLFIVAIPFGVVSMLLGLTYRETNAQREAAYRHAPFDSMNQFLEIGLSLNDFQKRKYPQALKRKQIRSPILTALYYLYWYVLWLCFSPVALLVQSLPTSLAKARVVQGAPSL